MYVHVRVHMGLCACVCARGGAAEMGREQEIRKAKRRKKREVRPLHIAFWAAGEREGA